LWNRNYGTSQITARKSVGVEHRGGFYETAGALRDMLPNHLFQLLTMTARSRPIFPSTPIKSAITSRSPARHPAVHPEDVLKNMVRGQYGAGMVAASASLAIAANRMSAPIRTRKRLSL